MSVLLWIVAASALGGLLSVVIAALFAWNAHPSRIPVLISFAVGALLAAVFLEILPHAFSSANDPRTIAATILFGILFFFVLEKLVLWRHCHESECDAHDAQPPQHDHGRSGMMIIIGDTVHNFVDGVLIAAAFVADIQVGVVTAIAIIAHEIPQEVGDFLMLLHSGYSRARALALNALSSIAMLAGGLLAYYSLQTGAAGDSAAAGVRRRQHDLRRRRRPDPGPAPPYRTCRRRAADIADRRWRRHGVGRRCVAALSALNAI